MVGAGAAAPPVAGGLPGASASGVLAVAAGDSSVVEAVAGAGVSVIARLPGTPTLATPGSEGLPQAAIRSRVAAKRIKADIFLIIFRG